MATKNKWGKSVKKDKAYYVGKMGDWTWYVLKVYGDPTKPYARAFCLVESPMAPGGDLGDVYATEIPGFIAAYKEAHS